VTVHQRAGAENDHQKDPEQLDLSKRKQVFPKFKLEIMKRILLAAALSFLVFTKAGASDPNETIPDGARAIEAGLIG
jgi:hypothetical protein